MASGGALLVTSKPLMPPSVSVALPLPPGNGRERQDADVILRQALAARRVRRLHAEQPLAHQVHRRLAVAEHAGRLRHAMVER